jgi:hypothetical protein
MAGSAEQSSNTVSYRRRLQLSYIIQHSVTEEILGHLYLPVFITVQILLTKYGFIYVPGDLGTLYTITVKSSYHNEMDRYS